MRVPYLAIGVALLLTVTAGSASAASSVRTGSTTVELSSDTTVIGPETRAILATVRVTTGKKGARFLLSFESPWFKRSVANRDLREGSALRFAGVQSISGPFGYNGTGASSRGGGSCGGFSDLPKKGGEDEAISYDAEIPAGSVVTLVARYEIVGDTPWANTNYSPRIRVASLRSWPEQPNRQTNKRKWDYFSKSTVLTVPRPAIAIPLAARIDLDFRPRPARQWWGLGPFPAGKPLEVIASIAPVRVGYPIKIWIDGQAVDRTFLTDENGQVRHTFKPRGGRPAIVRAGFLGAPGADLLPDLGCEAEVEIAKAKKGKG